MDHSDIPVPRSTQYHRKATKKTLPFAETNEEANDEEENHIDTDEVNNDDGSVGELVNNDTSFDPEDEMPQQDVDSEEVSSGESSDSSNEESSDSDTSSSEDELSQDSGEENTPNSSKREMSEQELHALALASFIVRHNLTGAATDDLIKLIQTLCPGTKTIENMTKQDIFGLTYQMNVRVVHYCQRCDTAFPSDQDIYRSTTDGCTGLRYKGGH